MMTFVLNERVAIERVLCTSGYIQTDTGRVVASATGRQASWCSLLSCCHVTQYPVHRKQLTQLSHRHLFFLSNTSASLAVQHHQHVSTATALGCQHMSPHKNAHKQHPSQVRCQITALQHCVQTTPTHHLSAQRGGYQQATCLSQQASMSESSPQHMPQLSAQTSRLTY